MNDEDNTSIKEKFQEPRKRFWPKSRKRPKSDAISISSMDISIDSDISKKKRRRITEIANNLFSSSTAINKLGNTSHKSLTIQPSSSDASIIEDEINIETLHKKLKNTEDCNNFTIKSWLLDVIKPDVKEHVSSVLSLGEIKRQEAIYELYCGENVLLNDLELLKDFYYEPMVDNCIFTSKDLYTVFGDLTNLIEIHRNFRDELLQLRDKSGFTNIVGPTIQKWVLAMKKPYIERCRTLLLAKHLLDERKFSNIQFRELLTKRLQSPRAVDLWTYLDVPRSRIVKYPLLIKEILKHTPIGNADNLPLKDASCVLSELLKNIDCVMGDAECKLAQSKIDIKIERDPNECIANATELITEGRLKNIFGRKYHCFLFDTCFAITNPITEQASKKYCLSFSVIPKEQMRVKIKNKNVAEIGFKIGKHTFITEDGHKNKHWIDSFSKLSPKVDIIRIPSTHDKENTELSGSNGVTTRSMSTTTSAINVNSNQLFFSLRRKPKQQRNSIIDYV